MTVTKFPLPAHVVFGVHVIFVIFAIIEDLAHAIYSISRSFASCPHCLGRDGSERILCRPCSKAGERTKDGFYFFCKHLIFQVRKSLMSGLAWTSYEAAVFSKKSPL